MDKTRVFFVVDGIEDNEEIFETLEEAVSFFLVIKHPRIRICLVKNAFKEHSYTEEKEVWNYKDHSDTFIEIADVTYLTKN